MNSLIRSSKSVCISQSQELNDFLKPSDINQDFNKITITDLESRTQLQLAQNERISTEMMEHGFNTPHFDRAVDNYNEFFVAFSSNQTIVVYDSVQKRIKVALTRDQLLPKKFNSDTEAHAKWDITQIMHVGDGTFFFFSFFPGYCFMVDFLPFFKENKLPEPSLVYYLKFATRGYGVRVIGVSKTTIIYADSLPSSVTDRKKHLYICEIQQSKLIVHQKHRIELFQIFGITYCPERKLVILNTEEGTLQSFCGEQVSLPKQSKDQIRTRCRGAIYEGYFVFPVNCIVDEQDKHIQIRMYDLESLEHTKTLCRIGYSDLVPVSMTTRLNMLIVCDPQINKIHILKGLQMEKTIYYSAPQYFACMIYDSNQDQQRLISFSQNGTISEITYKSQTEPNYLKCDQGVVKIVGSLTGLYYAVINAVINSSQIENHDQTLKIYYEHNCCLTIEGQKCVISFSNNETTLYLFSGVGNQKDVPYVGHVHVFNLAENNVTLLAKFDITFNNEIITGIRGSVKRKEVYICDYNFEQLFIFDYEGKQIFTYRSQVIPAVNWEEDLIFSFTDDRLVDLFMPSLDQTTFNTVQYEKIEFVLYDAIWLKQNNQLVFACDTVIESRDALTFKIIYRFPFKIGYWDDARHFMREKHEMQQIQGDLVAVRGYQFDFLIFNGCTGQKLLQIGDLRFNSWTIIGSSLNVVDSDGRVQVQELNILTNQFASSNIPSISQNISSEAYSSIFCLRDDGFDQVHDTQSFSYLWENALKTKDPKNLYLIQYPSQLTSLHYFAICKNLEGLQFAINNNVPIQKDAQGHTPVYYAFRGQQKSCISVLVAYLLSMDEERVYKALQLIPMEILISFNNVEILEKLGFKNIETSALCPDLMIPATLNIKEKETRYCLQKFDCYTYHTFTQLHQKVTSPLPSTILTKITASPIPCSNTIQKIEMLRFLSKEASNDILKTDLIYHILMQNWLENGRRYYLFELLVYLIFLFVLIYYYHLGLYEDSELVVDDNSSDDPSANISPHSNKRIILGSTTLIMNTIYAVQEMLQFRKQSYKYYFSHYLNIIDLVRIISIYIIVICSLTNQRNVNNAVPFLFTVFYVKLLTYLQCFKSTRYFIQMIKEVIQDIQAFMIILILAVLGYSQISVYLTQQVDVRSSFQSSYFMAFGEFGEYDSSTGIQIIILFIFIFFIPLILMNMLIAIIGNTYARVQENMVAADCRNLANLMLEFEELYTAIKGMQKAQQYEHLVYTQPKFEV